MRVQERFTRRDFGHLDVTVITDPKTFTKPFAINFVEELMPDTDVFEHVCYENEKDAAQQPAQAGSQVESHSLKTSWRVLKVEASVLADTVPNFFANRTLSTARI